MHPLNRFATGNKDTLEKIPRQRGIDVRSQLLDFHKKYYSSNLMTLCIVGNQSISELERMAKKFFVDIPNRKAENPSSAWWGQVVPYTKSDAAIMLDVVPIDDSRKISVLWPIWIPSPADKENYLYKKPESIVAHLLGHEGKGSLRSYLVAKGWANGVQAAVTSDLSDTQIFEVSISLTVDGLKNRIAVVDAVFAYLDLLKKEPIPAYVYDEVSRLSKISFDYSEKSDPSDYASRLVTDMQAFSNPSQYLIGSRLFQYPDPCAVQAYIAQLVPEQARVISLSKSLQSAAKLTAPYYGTRYSNHSAPTETLRWKEVSSSKYPFNIPAPNRLIPSSFELISSDQSSKLISNDERMKRLAEPPRLIRNDSSWQVWHKIDRVFNQPKVYAIFSLAIDEKNYDPLFIVRSKLFVETFIDSLNEYFYDAALAGLRFDLSFTSRGFDFSFSGFNDKLDVFIREIMSALSNFEVSERPLARFKDLLSREFQNWKTMQPYGHASYYANLATETLQYPIEELVAALKSSTSLAEMNKFFREVTRQSAGQALIIGNVLPDDAIKLVSIIDDTLRFEALPSNQRSNRQVAEYPTASSLGENKLGARLAHPEPNSNDENSAVSFIFQLPSREIADLMLLELLGQAIEQPFYNSLRTQQQLGYIVSSRTRLKDGIGFLSCTVQSSIASGPELTKRIETFIDEASTTFINLNDEMLDDFKEGLITQKLEPDQRLTSEAMRLWAEIVMASIRGMDQPLFNRTMLEVQAIQSITAERFHAFVRDFLSPIGSNRRLLVSEITSTKPSSRPSPTDLSEAEKKYASIADEIAFRDGLRLL
jgi:insulysin